MTAHFDPDPHSPSAPKTPVGMRPAPFDADDPRWSAYLLGELSTADRLLMEAVLEEDLAARREFEQLADVADLVRQALELEPQAANSSSQTDRPSAPLPLFAAISAVSVDSVRPQSISVDVVSPLPRRRRRIDGRLSFAAGVAALGLCLALVVQTGRVPPPQPGIPLAFDRPVSATVVAPLDRTANAQPTHFALAAEDGTRTFRYTPSLALAYREAESLADSRWDDASPVSARGHRDTFPERLYERRKLTAEHMTVADFSEAPSRISGKLPASGTLLLPSVLPEKPAAPDPGTNFAEQSANQPAAPASPPLAEPSEVRLVSRFQTPATVPVAAIPIRVARQTMAEVEQSLARGEWPAPETIRIEELVNAFNYDDPLPPGDEVAQLRVEAGDCPWNDRHRLVRIGMRAEPMNLQQRPPSRFVFMVNSSRPEMLSQLGTSLAEASPHFNPLDRFSIVDSYGRIVVPTVPGDQVEEKVRDLKESVTNLAKEPQVALQNAYRVANRNFIPGANNGVVMFTDELIMIEAATEAKLAELVRNNADFGINLNAIDLNANYGNTALGGLVRTGNGSVNTVSTPEEMSGAVVRELAGNQSVVAWEAQLEIEFNPVRVEAYRLLGYEHWNREPPAPEVLASQKELHAGDRLCAILEVRLNPETSSTLAAGPLRYRQQTDSAFVALRDNELPATPVDYEKEWLTARLTYTPTGSSVPTLREVPFDGDSDSGSQEIRWAASIVDFGQLLKEPDRLSTEVLQGIRLRAQGAAGPDPQGERQKFLALLQNAETLAGRGPQERALPEALPSREARLRATCDGRYRDLLDKLVLPDDRQRHGTFHDLGYQPGQSYRGHTDLPAGYWVYVYPHWYIWGAADENNALMAAPKE